jgi:DNA-binding NarL/FixJ family response regulator
VPTLAQVRVTPLTDRERDICHLLRVGNSNIQIAEILGVRPQWICERIQRICWKFGIHKQPGRNRDNLLAFVQSNGITGRAA